MACAVMMPSSSVPSGAVVLPVNDVSEDSPLLRLHDSILQDILCRADIQSRVAASVTCRRLARVSAEHPPLVVDLSSDGVHPEACRRYIERAKGAVITLTTARHRQRTACDAASARRFRNGVRCTQVVPYTAGPAAIRLASSLPNLQHLALHEATSCLGGMTDEFAAAVAVHCPLLSSLEVAFTRYSLPSEFFTDAGMMALAAGCPRLTCLSLTNCGAITNRSLYAVAVHCRGLSRLALGGYHELITDYGAVVLFQACTGLTRVVLSGKLRRVTDDSAEALASNSGGTLQEVKLTRSQGDKALAAFAVHCRALRLVDCCKCEPGALTTAGVAAMLTALTEASAAAAKERAAHVAKATPTTSGCDSVASKRLRVVLPHGVSATEVVRLGEEAAAAGGVTGLRWRAIVPAGAASSTTGAGGLAPPSSSLPPAAAPPAGTAASGAAGIPIALRSTLERRAAPSSGPSSSFSSSHPSPFSSSPSNPLTSPTPPACWVIGGAAGAAGAGGRSVCQGAHHPTTLSGSGSSGTLSQARCPAVAGSPYEEVLVLLGVSA